MNTDINHQAHSHDACRQPVHDSAGHAILFPPLPFDMSRRVSTALADPRLQQAIEAATLTKHEGRQRICNEAFGDDYPAMRELAGRIKQRALDHLDQYLEQFIDRAQAAGVQVHYAANAEQANALCLSIARTNGCRRCVKSKSMVTEETGLLADLAAAGIETVETDLGEFIIQLDDDAPSHIVTPMIHKDRYAVARAFQQKLGAAYTEDPAELTAIARRHLRDQYRRADLGISGANFLVAETGSVVLCTNEGNATFCTTAPPVHVVFAGIEKIVPTRRELAVLLKLLARSSTAQPLTVYTDFITGPRRPDQDHGPDQVHVILIDNGRTDILADPTFRQALRCIRCGACLNACPVYRKIGGHSYGAVYSGPIGAVITPLLRDLAGYKDLPNASSLCGACYEACPVKIDLPTLLIALRRRLVTRRIAPWWERLMYRLYAASLTRPWRYRLSNRLQRLALRLLAGRDGYVRKAPPPARAWTAHRDLPAPASQSFHQWWRRHRRSSSRD